MVKAESDKELESKMKIGGWIPLSKKLIKTIPRNRKWSDLEATFSLSLDYDDGKTSTVSGYAALWGWSRTRVKNFIDKLGIKLEYFEKTTKKQNQKGQIVFQIKDRSKRRSRTDKEQIRFIDSKWKGGNKGRSKTDKEQINGQIKDRSMDTTIDPISSNLDPNPKEAGQARLDVHKEIIDFFNKTCGTNYKPKSKETVGHMNARLDEGFTVEDFKTVIVKKYAEWKDDPVYCKFLKPTTLFRPSKFEGYLNQLTKSANGSTAERIEKKTKNEFKAFILEAVNKETEKDMEAFLRDNDKAIYGIVKNVTPFLFENKETDFRIIWRNYEEI